MMIKYCRAEHARLAVSSGRVRIGTVHGYQRIENALLRDQSEGVAPYLISAGKTRLTLTNAESNAVLQTSTLRLVNDWKLAFPAGARTRIVGEGFNTFVYSLSATAAPEPRVQRKLGYDAFFRIADVDEFALRIADTLKSVLGIPNEIRYARADCVYVDSKAIVITEDTRAQIQQKGRFVQLEDLFTKERAFELEQEHRIIWFIQGRTGAYSSVSRRDHVDLECPAIVPLLEA